MSKEKQKKSLLDLITAENLQEVNSDKKGFEELTKRFNEVTEFLFATDEVQKVLKEKDQKIADLEAKLAESEKRLVNCVDFNTWQKTAKENNQLKQQLSEKDQAIESLEELNRSLGQTCNNDIKEIERLNKLLAEKEKEYDLKYKHWIEEIRESDRLREELAKTNKEWVQSVHDWKVLCKKKDQDKISFAVEKLKEIQIYVDNQHFMSARYKCEKKVYADIWNFIDNQINVLRNNKDGIH